VPAFQDLNQAAGLIIPEIILIATVCIMFLAAPFLVTESGRAAAGLRHRWGILALLALGCAALAWLRRPLHPIHSGPSGRMLSRGTCEASPSSLVCC
jgi:NADH-quinone oxidoreductase subunit N